MSAISRYARPHLKSLHAYVPGDQPAGSGWIKLNTNELPFPPPESVGEAIAAEVSRLNRYPDPLSRSLRETLATRHGVDSAQVIVGNGSDDLLNLLVRAFGGPGAPTGQVSPSYSLYPVLVAGAGGELVSFDLEEGFQLPEAVFRGHGCRLFFLTSPNAPSGIRFDNESIRRLARATDGLLVVDEAYAEFAEGDARGLLASEPNLIITRTFSKAYGLAGLRVGYALGPADVVATLDRIRDSYNVNRVSHAGALAALGEQAAFDELVERIRRTRRRVGAALGELGWRVYPSETNFLLGEPCCACREASEACADDLFGYLKERRILVRRFRGHPLTERALRITVGTDDEMDTFLETVKQWSRQDG